jgi:hypothetical protein
MRSHLLALLACVAGCSTPTGPAQPRQLTSASPDPLASAAVPIGMASPTPAPIVSGPSADALLSLPWRLVALDGNRLTILYVAGDGSCVLPVGIQVAETTDQVEVWARSRRAGGQQCPDRLVRGVAYVDLAELLGRRVLLHAPVEREWAGTRP